jgi:hypothetical protein
MAIEQHVGPAVAVDVGDRRAPAGGTGDREAGRLGRIHETKTCGRSLLRRGDE